MPSISLPLCFSQKLVFIFDHAADAGFRCRDAENAPNVAEFSRAGEVNAPSAAGPNRELHRHVNRVRKRAECGWAKPDGRARSHRVQRGLPTRDAENAPSVVRFGIFRLYLSEIAPSVVLFGLTFISHAI